MTYPHGGVTTLGVLASDRANFWLDYNNRKHFERCNEDLPKTALIPAKTVPANLYTVRLC